MRGASEETMPDKTLTCRDCGSEFLFTASEQQFYAEKGFTNEPSRCPACRAAHKASRGGGRCVPSAGKKPRCPSSPGRTGPCTAPTAMLPSVAVGTAGRAVVVAAVDTRRLAEPPQRRAGGSRSATPLFYLPYANGQRAGGAGGRFAPGDAPKGLHGCGQGYPPPA